MDSQSISPVNGGSTPATQSQAYVPPTHFGKNTQTQNDAPTEKDSKTTVDVRMRDPRSLQYQVDGSTKQVVATIVDESNKTVVVQIPNEEVLRIAAAIDRMKGFLLEGKA